MIMQTGLNIFLQKCQNLPKKSFHSFWHRDIKFLNKEHQEQLWTSLVCLELSWWAESPFFQNIS